MRTSFGIALVVALLVVTSGAWAGNIPVGNPSFESPVCGAAGSGTNCTPNSWTVTNSANQWNPTTGQYTANQFPSNLGDTSLPDGIQAAWVNGGANSLSQILATTIAANTTYTLTIDVGLRTTVNNTFGAIVDLDAFSAVAGTTVLTNDTSASPGSGNEDPGHGSWALWTVTFNSASNPSVVGQDLEIYLSSSTNQTGYDNVSLNGVSNVPEPAMFALVGFGLLGLVTRRRFAK